MATKPACSFESLLEATKKSCGDAYDPSIERILHVAWFYGRTNGFTDAAGRVRESVEAGLSASELCARLFMDALALEFEGAEVFDAIEAQAPEAN